MSRRRRQRPSARGPRTPRVPRAGLPDAASAGAGAARRKEREKRDGQEARDRREAHEEREERDGQEAHEEQKAHEPTAEGAFDALYIRTAPALLRQAEVLTGDPVLARRAVTHAFDLAWQRWPEVARDSDPAGWVRAAAYEYALAPWQRWLPGRTAGRRPQPQGPLEAALLGLPPTRRRALVLYDGLGLDLPETAAESEATILATAVRITRARGELAAAVLDVTPGEEPAAVVSAVPAPGPAPGPDRPDERIAARLSALLDPERVGEPPARPEGVRGASERGVRHRTLGAYALTGLIAAATLTAVLTEPGAGRHVRPDDDAGRQPYVLREDAAGRPPFGEPARDVLP